MRKRSQSSTSGYGPGDRGASTSSHPAMEWRCQALPTARGKSYRWRSQSRKRATVAGQ